MFRFAVQPVVLENEVVRLEPFGPQHRDGLWQVGQDRRIWPFMPLDGGTADGFAAMLDEIGRETEAGRQIVFVVRDRGDARVIGSSRYLNIDRHSANLEIGWTWYAPSVWASAVNPACKLLLLGHAFDTLGAVRVGLRCDARNTRSHDASLRLGAVREGVFRRHKRVQNGFIRDTVQFSILDSEWPDVRDRLDQRLKQRKPVSQGTG